MLPNGSLARPQPAPSAGLTATTAGERFTLPDRRTLGFARYGDAGGHPVFYFHGFPASRLEAELLDAAARRVGIALIAPDRPGFGLSGLQPNRTILDWPNDVAALADALGLGRFSLLGGSAGCPYALASACRLRRRVVRVATIAGLGPTTEPEAVRRMGRAARLGFCLARRAPFAFRLIYGALALVVAHWPGLVYRLNPATRPDRVVLARAEVRSILDASVQEAFRHGTAGAVQELSLLASPWGFDLGQLSAPLDVWHGKEDGVVPHVMGELLAHEAPNAQLHSIANEAHVSLPFKHGVEILKRLVASKDERAQPGRR